MGAILSAHGIKGEVKVKTFTLKPGNLALYGPLITKSGRRLTVLSARATQIDQAVVAFEGVGDRDAAETLNGEELFVSRAALPPPASDEFYEADLLGLKAEDRTGKPLGKVRALHNFGAGEVIEIELLDGNTEFVPFHSDSVEAVDLEGGRIVIELPSVSED